MAVSQKHCHLSPEVVYDCVKGGLDRQHLAEVQAHVGVCARCAALVARGRLILKWLKGWSVEAQNLAYGRVLLRESLVRVTAGVGRESTSRRLIKWRRNTPARYAALFSFTAAPAGRAGEAVLTGLSLLPEKAPGLRLQGGARGGVSARREMVRQEKGKRGRRSEHKPRLSIEAAGKSDVLIRGEFDLGDSPAPLVLLVACRHRAEPQLKAMRKVRGNRSLYEARFAGIAPGRYVLALEPAVEWLRPWPRQNSRPARPE